MPVLAKTPPPVAPAIGEWLGALTPAGLRRDPLKGMGLAVASGMLLRWLLGHTARSALRRVQR